MKKSPKTKAIRKVIYKVIEISGPENCLEVKMLGSDGTKIRFSPSLKDPWAFQVWVTGVIPHKAQKFIVDDWYVGQKSMAAKVGDFVSINFVK